MTAPELSAQERETVARFESAADAPESWDEFWYDAAERLAGMKLHPTHLWVAYADADCFDGIHAPMRCQLCGINPMPGVCFHELRPGNDRTTWVCGKGAAEKINPAADLACPDATR